MSRNAVCNKCGSALTSFSAGEFCPRCLMTEGFGSPGGDDAIPTAESNCPRQVGDYDLLEEIARGGMGVVYKARQRSLGRIVAIKMLLAGEFASRDAVQRFRAEAAAAAKLQHPNIVAIHEVGEHGGLAYLCMDYVDGPNLAELIRDHPLPPERAATYLKTIAETVHQAHRHGIIHRDLKPSNVLIDPFGEPRITDFGLAKELTLSSHLTVTGQLVGSPSYMSPEQADPSRGPLTPASDVYSLGAVLYHLIAGCAPFVSGSLHETLRQVLAHEPVSPRLINRAIPRDLETICLKCLAKDPAKRYGTAGELAADLARFLHASPIRARPIGHLEKLRLWRRRQPALAALGGAVFLLLLTLAVGATAAALHIAAARRAEVRERERAQRTALQLELQRADDLAREDKVSSSLAYLARVLREDPGNRVAATRIISILAARSFGLPLCQPLEHGAPVLMTAFSPDGRRVATASEDGTARLWDAQTGTPLGEPLEHKDSVSFVKFTSDSSRLVTASKDKTACIWDAQTGRRIGEPLNNDGPVVAAELGQDGNTLATVTGATAKVWDIRSGRLLAQPFRHDKNITCVDVSSDGRFLLLCGLDGVANIWDIRSEKLLRKIRFGNWARYAVFSPGADRVAVAWQDGHVRIIEVTSGKVLGDMVHHDVVEQIAFSPDGSRLATASREAVAKVWDGFTGELLAGPFRHYTVVKSVEFSADGLRLLTTCWDNTAWVWDIRMGDLVVEPLKHGNRINAASLSPDGQRIITASADHTAMIWDVRRGGQSLARFHNRGETGVCFSKDGGRLLTWSADGEARVWGVPSGQPMTPVLKHSSYIVWGDFSPDGTKVITGSMDRTAVIWDAATGNKLTTIASFKSVVQWVEFSPDGKSALTASRDGIAQVWNAATGTAQGPAMKHRQRIWMARFSNNGKRIVTSSDDGTARIWDAKTGAPVGLPLQHQDAVYAAAFSPDGSRVVTASFDMTARIWRVGDGKPLFSPLRHYSGLRWAEFSPDGKKVVTASGDNTARVWDAETGEPIGEPLHHRGEVWRAQFSRNGQWIATVSHDGTSRVWDANTGQPVTVPLLGDDWFAHTCFSPNSRWLAVGQHEGGALLWELPDAAAQLPPWLADLAEAVAMQKVSSRGGFDFVPPTELLKLRNLLRDRADSDYTTRFARWFFADRAARNISPSSTLGTRELTERLAQENTASALGEALKLAPVNRTASSNLADVPTGTKR